MPTNRTATARWKRLRRTLIKTRAHECHWCGLELDPAAPRGARTAIEIDHLEPVALRPDLAHDEANLVLTCHPCNRSKGDREAPGPRRTVVRREAVVCRVHGDGANLTPACPCSGALRKPWDPLQTAYRARQDFHPA